MRVCEFVGVISQQLSKYFKHNQFLDSSFNYELRITNYELRITIPDTAHDGVINGHIKLMLPLLQPLAQHGVKHKDHVYL
jgi:hypothetical protein